MNRLLTRLLALAVLLAASRHAGAAMMLDQSFVPPPSANLSAVINEGFDLAGQVFTAGQTGTLAGVNVSITGFRATPLRISIYEVVAGNPTSNLLGSTTLSGNSSSLSELVTFSTPIDYVAGSQYLIAADYPGPPRGAGQGQGSWQGLSGGGYPDGIAYFGNFVSGDSGPVNWFAEPSYDLHFQTYVETSPSAVPVPPTFLLAGIGALGLGGYAWRRRKEPNA